MMLETLIPIPVEPVTMPNSTTIVEDQKTSNSEIKDLDHVVITNDGKFLETQSGEFFYSMAFDLGVFEKALPDIAYTYCGLSEKERKWIDNKVLDLQDKNPGLKNKYEAGLVNFYSKEENKQGLTNMIKQYEPICVETGLFPEGFTTVDNLTLDQKIEIIKDLTNFWIREGDLVKFAENGFEETNFEELSKINLDKIYASIANYIDSEIELGLKGMMNALPTMRLEASMGRQNENSTRSFITDFGIIEYGQKSVWQGPELKASLEVGDLALRFNQRNYVLKNDGKFLETFDGETREIGQILESSNKEEQTFQAFYTPLIGNVELIAGCGFGKVVENTDTHINSTVSYSYNGGREQMYVAGISVESQEGTTLGLQVKSTKTDDDRDPQDYQGVDGEFVGNNIKETQADVTFSLPKQGLNFIGRYGSRSSNELVNSGHPDNWERNSFGFGIGFSNGDKTNLNSFGVEGDHNLIGDKSSAYALIEKISGDEKGFRLNLGASKKISNNLEVFGNFGYQNINKMMDETNSTIKVDQVDKRVDAKVGARFYFNK